MKVTKKVISDLTKCYSIAPLKKDGENRILVAAEKHDPCLLFDDEGNLLETVWTEPGGVMTMVQVPGSDGAFLATHKFYSPNDSKEAKIIIAEPGKAGAEGWTVRTLTDLPFVHRFDILKNGNQNWLIACALKSGHEYKEDWSSPGKVWAGQLPADLSAYNENNQLELKPIAEGFLKNHGYCRLPDHVKKGTDSSLVCADNGVFIFTPPDDADGQWKTEQILNQPASDALLIDLDQDGRDELIVLSPFHGDQISIYKDLGNGFEKIWDYGKPAEFLHAVTTGKIGGKPVAFIGWRKGERDLIALSWDPATRKFVTDVIDTGRGPANAYYYNKDGRDMLVATNRETDEVALYEIEG